MEGVSDYRGPLGAIGGSTIEDVEALAGEGVDLGRVTELKDFSQSQMYQTPNDVFGLLLEKAHLSSKDGEPCSHGEYVWMARELIAGASTEELQRFVKLVIATKDYFGNILEGMFLDEGEVGQTMADLRFKYAEVLDSEDERATEAEKLLRSTEYFLGAADEVKGDLNFREIRSRASGFAYAVETVAIQRTGMAF